MLNGISSKNTQHKYETFDGVKLNFTNWKNEYEPKLWDGVIFSYENDKPILLGKCLKLKIPGQARASSPGVLDRDTKKIVFRQFLRVISKDDCPKFYLHNKSDSNK